MERFNCRKIILENNTAEGQAEKHKFNHLVSMCTVYIMIHGETFLC